MYNVDFVKGFFDIQSIGYLLENMHKTALLGAKHAFL